MSKEANHANKKAKVYEAEQELRASGLFTFRRGNAHGLFHVVAFDKLNTLFVQVQRLHSFNYQDIEKELVKVQDFVLNDAPVHSVCELWVWVNNRGWIKFRFDFKGNYTKFEDYGTHHYRAKNNEMVDLKRIKKDF